MLTDFLKKYVFESSVKVRCNPSANRQTGRRATISGGGLTAHNVYRDTVSLRTCALDTIS